MNKLKKEFNQMIQETGKFPIFEIEVIDNRTKETDYIICEVMFTEETIFCQRIGVNQAEEQSNLIATSSIDIDPDNSLNSHLEELLEEINNDIANSEFYTLKN